MTRSKSIFIAAAISLAVILGACSNPADAIIRANYVNQGGGGGGGAFTVQFETNGGSLVDPISAADGAKLTEPSAPIKDNASFLAWYRYPDWSGAPWNFLNDTITADITLYARWNYTVQFETNGGSLVASELVADGDKIPRPSRPVKPGYYFAGWYRNTDFIELWDFANDTVENVVTLHAKWISFTPMTTLAEISKYLDEQTEGGSTINPVPLKVTMMNLGDLTLTAGTNWRDMLAVLAAKNKYVVLDISDSSITGTSFNHNNYTMVSGMDRIVDIVLPSGITSIGDYAFNDCTNLALTELPSGITSIGNTAFYGCTNLALTELPSGITSIESSAFRGCTNLALTELPSGITSIENYVFFGCTNVALTSLPSGITIIGEGAFENTKLALTSLPSGITFIGNFTFLNCTNLALTSLPAGITSIRDSAFYGCTKLESMSLPAGITSIEESAFERCTNLATLTINASTPPTLGTDAFRYTASGLAIKVPAASVADYKAKPDWSDYAGIISGF